MGINILEEINNKINVLSGRWDILVEFLIFYSDFHRATLTLWHNLIDNLIGFVKIQAMSFESSESYLLVCVINFYLLLKSLDISLCRFKRKQEGSYQSKFHVHGQLICSGKGESIYQPQKSCFYGTLLFFYFIYIYNKTKSYLVLLTSLIAFLAAVFKYYCLK